MHLKDTLRQGAGLILDTLLPPRCLACGVIVDEVGRLCADCWKGVSFLSPPHCGICGFPFDHDLGHGVLCAACLRRPPDFDRARAVMRYDEGGKGLILAFKHGDRTDSAPPFGAWLARAGAELLPECDLIAPVPLHPFRLLARRYNQAALLAIALGRASGRTVIPDLLRRRRHTPSQGGLSASARKRNVSGAFQVRQCRRESLDGARVLLVDDVLTTGATAEACTRVLRAAGAEAVDVLTLARVVRPASGAT